MTIRTKVVGVDFDEKKKIVTIKIELDQWDTKKVLNGDIGSDYGYLEDNVIEKFEKMNRNVSGDVIINRQKKMKKLLQMVSLVDLFSRSSVDIDFSSIINKVRKAITRKK